MATSPGIAASNHLPRSRPGSLNDRDRGRDSPGDEDEDEDDENHDLEINDVAVETLVEHLLAAKRSLSSMTLVLRANDLATHARQLHEEAVILSAQTAFLRRGITEQVRVLLRLRKGMSQAYENGKKEFRALLRTLDAADGRLESTLKTLRETVVDSVFRPTGEEPKCLIDFVDEKSVDGIRDSLKESIAELQAAQTSFDGDLLRFDNDLRLLHKVMGSAPSGSPSLPDYRPIPHLLDLLTTHSREMAQHLTSLTRHFDMCVTAVRTTEGGAALALRKAAEVTQSQHSGKGGQQQWGQGGGAVGAGESVSISGVIAAQESHVADLEPMGARERAEVVQVVVQDAPEVDEVVADLTADLQQAEVEFGELKHQSDRIRAAYLATVAAFHALEEMGSRLRSYAAAEAEYAQRREAERESVAATLEQMDQLRQFYEGYVGAYNSLMFEVARRKEVEKDVQTVWRYAQDNVNKLVEADAKARNAFRQDVGEYLPTDLWVGMNAPLRRWDVVQIDEPSPTPVGGLDGSSKLSHRGGPAVDGDVLATMKQRPTKGTGGNAVP